ncbi:MAG: lactate utilization protein [Desulfopila sp.]|jgi:L-lactate dehydrogenase complex protein LldG|nr:lactate utilization protein [Desulfopila sp.]
MGEKEAFMAGIREALGYAAEEVRGVEECRLLFSEKDDRLILDRIRYRTHVEKQALLQILQENGRQLNLDVQVVPSLAAAADTIVDIIRAGTPEFSSARQIIQHDHQDIAALQLWKRFAGEAVAVHTSYPADREVPAKSAESCVGITVPSWAAAESATVVQLTKPGRPRSTSLLPSVHIALLRLEFLLADLSEIYALLRFEPPRESFVFITGPSKTADIEAHMVHGAHGPREMHLVVIDEHMVQLPGKYRGSGLFPPE